MCEKCDCGRDLPLHLFKHDLPNFSHVCYCDRRWVKLDGDIVQDGEKENFNRVYDEPERRSS